MIDPVFINMDCAGAPGAGVPPVSLRAEARPADLRRPVPHPKPGAHSRTVAAGKTSGSPPGRPPLSHNQLAPYPSDEMTCWPVSARVGNVKNNDASLIEPITAA
jgi:hypothetical protein